MYFQSYSYRVLTHCFCVLMFACLSVPQAYAAVPVITSEAEVCAVVGQPFSYTIEAEHQPLAYSVANIPYWLHRDAAKLSGTPKVPGTWTIQLLALNADGVSQPVELKIQVLNDKATFTPLARPNKLPVAISLSDEKS